MDGFKLAFTPECNTGEDQLSINYRKSQKYPRVKRSKEILPPVAVCGGGPGVSLRLDILRKWNGDIYAVNDMAGYLSDNGIENYLFAVDASRIPYKIGPLVKGAVLASLVHRKQFSQFRKDQIRVFDMYESNQEDGVGGGTTAMCRAPNLFIKMGYGAVCFFGCEGSFFDYSHVTGYQSYTDNNRMIIRVAGVDYITTAAMYLQNQYLAERIAAYPEVLFNFSDGLLKAMIDHKQWQVIAVSEDLKKKIHNSAREEIYTSEYDFSNKQVWKPQEASI